MKALVVFLVCVDIGLSAGLLGAAGYVRELELDLADCDDAVSTCDVMVEAIDAHMESCAAYTRLGGIGSLDTESFPISHMSNGAGMEVWITGSDTLVVTP